MSDPVDESIAERLLEIESALAGEDLGEAEALLAQLEGEMPDEAELHFLRGHLCLMKEDVGLARAAFQKAVDLDATHAEAWYELAGVRNEEGDVSAAREALLEVHRLDELSDKEAEWLTDENRAGIARMAEDALSRLPAQFRERLTNVAVVIDDRPPKEIVSEGFDPRALGLFDGPDDFEQRATSGEAVPTKIVLFAANLLSDFLHPELLQHEVEITVLHEVAHYFGMDEEEVEALGLA